MNSLVCYPTFADIDQFYIVTRIWPRIMEPIICKEIFNLVNVRYIECIMPRIDDDTISSKIINFRNLQEINFGSSARDINNIGILSSFNNLSKINLSRAKFPDDAVTNLDAHKICVDNGRLKKL